MILCPSCNHKNDDGAKFCPKCGAALVRATGSNDDDVIGRIIAGKFRIEALIGEGGMGKVFRATKTSLDKTVVLKVLRTSLLGDARTVASFQREAKAASRLNHPNSISVIDFGQSDDGSLFIAMEHVAGEDLHQLLSREGPLPQKRACHIAGQVLSALADAHAAGVIHRDLKPENIMVEQRRGEDFVKVLDFGIAKIQENDGHEGQALTRAGFVCGTPEYMSPEQARGLQLDARSDLYAVGVILYQCATNSLPFEADSAVGLATMHLTTAPTPPRQKRPDAPISDAMEALILRAMEKDPAHRPQSADDFRRELQALQNEDNQATRVEALPPPRPLRASGGVRKQRSAPPAPASPPTWATSPGSGDERTAVTSRATFPGPPDRRPAKGRSPVVLFLAALVGTALVAGAGLLGYDRLVRRGAEPVALDAPEPGSGPGVEPGRDPAPDGEDRGRQEKLRSARDAIAKGDALLASDAKEALKSYVVGYEQAPSAMGAKRIALGYLMINDPEGASRWLRDYLKDLEREGSSDPVVERFLGERTRP